jgi:hypothetical protein
VLRDHCYVEMTSPVIIATLRARAIVHDKFTTHACFWAASKELDDYSSLDLSPPLHVLKADLELTAVDGKRWMDADHNVWASLEESTPAYSAHLAKLKAATVNSVDGSTKHLIYEKVRASPASYDCFPLCYYSTVYLLDRSAVLPLSHDPYISFH